METEPEIKDASDAEELTDVKGLVRYENVSFHYADDDTSVLSHISFEIPAGRSVALVGVGKWKNNDLFPSATFLRCDRRQDHNRRKKTSEH